MRRIIGEDKYGWPIEESETPQAELDEADEAAGVDNAEIKKDVNDLLAVMWDEIQKSDTTSKKTESLTMYQSLDEGIKDDLKDLGKNLMVVAALISAPIVGAAAVAPEQLSKEVVQGIEKMERSGAISQDTAEKLGKLGVNGLRDYLNNKNLASEQERELKRAVDAAAKKKPSANEQLNAVKKAIDGLADFGHDVWGWDRTAGTGMSDSGREADMMGYDWDGPRKPIGIGVKENSVGKFIITVNAHQVVGNFDKGSGSWKIELKEKGDSLGVDTAQAIANLLQSAAEGNYLSESRLSEDDDAHAACPVCKEKMKHAPKDKEPEMCSACYDALIGEQAD